jgi:GNAT superfamily N-acetyltransferase
METPRTDWAFVAEDADTYQYLPPSVTRDVRPDVVLICRPDEGAWSKLASRVRFEAATVASGIAASRGWFADRRVAEFRWLIGPSATPAGIVPLLLARGAARDEAEPDLTAMVLDREPPSVDGIPVRPVASFVDFEQMEQIRDEVFGRPDGTGRATRRARWSEFQAAGSLAYLAEVDGAPVSFGVMDRTEAGPMLLAGGVTLPRFRGRGAYRALVHARWEAAERAGAAVLVTQAQAASRPILERLGFRSTGTIEVLVDRT